MVKYRILVEINRVIEEVVTPVVDVAQIPVTALLFKVGSQYHALQKDAVEITNNSDAATVITAALAYINGLGGGRLHSTVGNYRILTDVTIPSGENYILTGDGFRDDRKNPTTSGGTNWHFENGARFIGAAGMRLTCYDMGFSTQQGDTWTDSAFGWMGIAPAVGQVVVLIRCAFSIRGIHPVGSSTNPKGTPEGIVIAIGRDSGPSGFPMVVRGCEFYDAREGTNANNTFLGIKAESLIFDENFWYLDIPAGLVTPNLFYDEPVSYSIKRGSGIFTDAAMAGQYEHQYVCVGGSKNHILINEQLIDGAFISGTHFTHHGGGTLIVTGENVFQSEGGNVPILPTGDTTNGGVIKFRLTGPGWVDGGEAEASDGDTIGHDLLGKPVKISGTVEEVDAVYILNFTADGSDLTVALFDQTAGVAEAVNKTISWGGVFQFDVT